MTMYKMPPHVTATYFDDCGVVLDARRNLYFALNASAARFVRVLVDTGSFQAAVDHAIASHSEPAARIERDMTELIATLVERGLVYCVRE